MGHAAGPRERLLADGNRIDPPRAVGVPSCLSAGVRWRRVFFRLYAVAVVATAAFAEKPWFDGRFDEFEATIHSVAASVAGLSFGIGVLFVTVRRAPNAMAMRSLDWIAILAMFGSPSCRSEAGDIRTDTTPLNRGPEEPVRSPLTS